MTGLIFTMTQYYTESTQQDHVRCWIPDSMLHSDLLAAWPAISSLNGVTACRPVTNGNSNCFDGESYLTGRNHDRFDDLSDCLQSRFNALVCYVPKYTSPNTRNDYVEINFYVGETNQCPLGSHQVLLT